MSTFDDHRKVLRLSKKEVNAITEAAFYRLIDEITKRPDRDVRDIIAEINAGFDERYTEQLSKSFSDTLQKSVGTEQVRNYTIGNVTLSQKLYSDSAKIALQTYNAIKEHVQGWHDARALSMRLYDGYSDVPDVLEWSKYNKKLPINVRKVVLSDPKSSRELISATRRYVGKLKTPQLRAAYSELIDAIEKGAGAVRLQKVLDNVYHRQMRTNANRIAQTELHRAWSDEQAVTMNTDESITAVRYTLSSTHPADDICDVYAKQDKYGLGAGIYPKHLAPVPPMHPYCRCRLVSRRLIDGTKGVEKPDATKTFLQGVAKKDAKLAGKIAGSQAKLAGVLEKGYKLEDMYNAGKPKEYWVGRTVRDIEPNLQFQF